ncbi:ATP-binding cassette domain-containing protein [Natronoglycomyces albus]|uniref:ATP-binding cassette domain-containing protein n=1 Tax=Natronoglycomyces albus TaxID=2811108 RepID=A0A895XSP1_9ACTN|nr:ATP-binding cassette domain-containing protein [Natronoglycomyces albus]QSB06339.1 ATP-binding cassette domain-containing protein [Natronoglycomyces albus]
MKPLIAKDLSQGYGTSTVFDGLNLDVPAGVTGLLGPNGAGKTTLLQTLATVRPPRAGSLEIRGLDATVPASLPQIRSSIGYLPQEFGYPRGFSIHEFVLYCAWLRGVDRARRDELVAQAIRAVDLHEDSKRKMHKLSGGMRQRCGIAATIVGDPALVILDEPTVGLDPMQRIAFRDILTSLPNRDDTCVILSTHLVEDIATTCDSVAVMDGGRIIYFGSVDDFASTAESGAPGSSELERAYSSAIARNEVA